MKLSKPGFKRPHAESAYTIAEVVVAVLVLTTVMIGIYGGFSYGFSTVQTAREDLRATQILVQKTEAVRVCNWSDLWSNCPINFKERYDPIGVASNAGGVTYYGTLALCTPTNIPDTAAYKTNVTLVNIKLTWTNYNGSKVLAHNREMQTQVARYGLQGYIWGTQ
ncbi:MAG TPA: hypothetical protein VN578_08005 [Candidatus Binatia bacterium]|jgi:hypothetical protein|nr:hypothetical protein [Candidatus Binatia bacterium]